MALTNAEIKRNSREKKRLEGLKRFEVYIANNKEAEVDLKMYVSYLNQKYNMMKIGE